MSAFVSVVIPARNEEKFIESCVRSLLQSDYPATSFEVIVADGESTDRTAEIIKAMADADSRVRLVPNPARTTPQGVNIAIRAARGSIILLFGAHAEAEPTFIRKNVEALEAHPECGCVGGVIESVCEDRVAQEITVAMSSPFGVGGAAFRTGTRFGYVDTVAFGCYRREVLESIGLLDEALIRNQDDELNFRVTRAGWKILLSPEIRSRYYVRSSFRHLFRQYLQYGYWKVFVNRKHGVVTSVRQLIPPAFVLALAVTMLAGLAWAEFWLLLGLILVAYFASAWYFCVGKVGESVSRIGVMKSFLMLHFGYGLGYLMGIWELCVLRRAPNAQAGQLTR